MNTKRKIN